MKIAPIFPKIKPCSLSFGSTKRTKYLTEDDKVVVKPFYDKGCDFFGPKEGKILVSNSTNFFRNDLPWNTLGKTLDELYPEGEKVNVFNFACSDGSEPYSLAICLIEQLGEEKAKRFFPINASDIDSDIMPKGKKDKIIADKKDIENINEITNNNIKKYFNVKHIKERTVISPKGTVEFKDEEFILTPKKILKDCVKFDCKNFYDGLDDLKEKNNLVLCRNFWGYLKEDEILKCAKKLYNRLDESSFMIIGDFDLDDGNIPKFLTELGIDSATDTWKEETILQKHEGYSDGKYKDELLMNIDAYYYHRKKC